MSQTASSLRGRHYANKVRAAQIASSSTTTTSSALASRSTVSSESLARRLKSTRFQNTRYASPSRYSSPSRTRYAASTSSASHASPGPTTETSREMELVRGISDRLDTGLNEDALLAILDLVKRGEHPDAIVAVVTSLAQQQSR